jgi:cell wall assembly regulator SMI1
MADQVPALWGEIVTWLRRNAPADAGRLRPPASDSLISEVQAAVGCPLPEDVQQWWRQADGAVGVAGVYLMPSGFAPMSCRDALEDRAMRVQITAELALDEESDPDDEDWDDEDLDDEDADEPEFVGFHPYFLPIGDDHCGNCLYVDLRDGPEHGFIKFFDHEDYNSTSAFYWRSLTEMLAEIRDALISHEPGLLDEAPRRPVGPPSRQAYRATITPEGELRWVPTDSSPPRLPAPATTRHPDRGYDDVLRRYRDLLAAPYPQITAAMSWSVITGQTDLAAVIRRLGGDPAKIREQRPVDDDHKQPCWYLDEASGTVTLLEVNGLQAHRPEVLQRLSGRSNQMFSAYWGLKSKAFWNIRSRSAFSYAAAGEVITQFDGRNPARRSGSEPDALLAEQGPVWAAAGGSWQAAMLALTELRTGVPLDATWFEQPHPVVIKAEIPDGTSGTRLNGEIVALLCQKENPRRHAALAWLTQALAERFDLNDPALRRAIEARHAHTPVDAETEAQVRDMTGDLVRQMLARDETVPQHVDPVWRRGQAAMAAVNVLDFFDPSILILHAENAFADDWHLIATQLRSRL